MGLDGDSSMERDQQRRLLAKNRNTSTTIPARAVLKVYEVEYNPQTGDTYVIVDVTDEKRTKLAVFNLESAIVPEGFGYVTYDFPCLALYESSDGTPGLDEYWGTQPGSYKLHKRTEPADGTHRTKPWQGDGIDESDVIVVFQEICRP